MQIRLVFKDREQRGIERKEIKLGLKSDFFELELELHSINT